MTNLLTFDILFPPPRRSCKHSWQNEDDYHVFLPKLRWFTQAHYLVFRKSRSRSLLKVQIFILISEATGVSKHVFYACLVLSSCDFLVKSFVACIDNQAWLPTLVCPLNVVTLSHPQRIPMQNVNTGECQQHVSVLQSSELVTISAGVSFGSIQGRLF